jgi:hypothetical protein
MTAIKNLSALLVLSFLASGVLGWFLFQSRSDLRPPGRRSNTSKPSTPTT